MDYSKLYNGLISFRTLNTLTRSKRLYTEGHHIVPSCLGGPDSPENMIRLTGREHFIAHRLLSKIHPENADLAYAVFLMSQQHQDRKICSREYDKLRKLFTEERSKIMTERWKDPEYRGKMVEVGSKSLTEQWKDQEYRGMMAEVVSKRSKELWKDPEYRITMAEASSKTLTELWKNPEYRSKMAEVTSNTLTELWKNPEYRSKMAEVTSNTLTEQHKDPEFRAKMLKARLDWFKVRKGQSWLMPNAKKTKEIWSLAQLFWEHNKNNPNVKEPYTPKRFCEIFNEGKHVDVFYKMHKKFVQENWIPKLDRDWLREFGNIHY